MSHFSGFPAVPGRSGWPWTDNSCSCSLRHIADSDWPRISIVTPSFNQGRYLEKTIRSVLLQGYPNLEYLVIDGGSIDGSVNIISKYAPWLTFWVSEKDRGQSHAINKGFARATGELLGWLNSDDWYLPGALWKLAETYLEDRSVGAVYGQGHIIDEHGALCHRPKLEQVTYEGLFDWFSGHDFMQPSCLFTREAYDRCGPLDESLHISMDVDLWINIAKHYQFRKIEDLLSIALRHKEAKTTHMKNAMYVDFAVVLMRHGNETKAREVLQRLMDRADLLESRCGFMDGLTLQGLRRRFSGLLGKGS